MSNDAPEITKEQAIADLQAKLAQSPNDAALQYALRLLTAATPDPKDVPARLIGSIRHKG